MTQEELKRQLKDQPFSSLSDLVYQHLFDEIAMMKLQPGDKIREAQIAKDLGISRSPVKAAVTRLAEEGLAEKNKGRCPIVSPIDPNSYIELYDARIGVECQAAYLAAKTVTSKELEELRRLLEEFEKAKREGDVLSFIRCDDLFHQLIIDATRNKCLMDMYRCIKPRLLRYRYHIYRLSAERTDNRSMVPVNYHLAIYNALKNHLSSAAREEMEADLGMMYKTFQRLW